MAKRPTIRSEADDVARSAAAPRARRSRADAANLDTQAAHGATFQERPIELDPAPGAEARDTIRAVSTRWQPSEEDIRLRAYHRYLERGGAHGCEFDDWVEAERELKARG